MHESSQAGSTCYIDKEQVLALLKELEITDVNIYKDSYLTLEMPDILKYLIYLVNFKDVNLSIMS